MVSESSIPPHHKCAINLRSGDCEYHFNVHKTALLNELPCSIIKESAICIWAFNRSQMICCQTLKKYDSDYMRFINTKLKNPFELHKIKL